MTKNETLREMLTERGVDWKAFDLFQQTTEWSTHNGAFVYWARELDGELLVETTAPTKCSESCTPAQAIAATVGGTVWEPSKEWKAWHESLKHDNPTNIREAVENILFDAIDFGGDMGPNGNVWSGVDEGDVLTEKCIDEWVRSIESVAATVEETCRLVDNESGPDMHCTACGRNVDDEYRYFMEGYYGYSRCPHCGRRIEVAE